MRIFLTDAGERRINVIREIRSFTGATLKDAKDLSETPNALLFDGRPRDAAKFLKALKAVGATVSADHGPNPIPRWLRALADWIED